MCSSAVMARHGMQVKIDSRTGRGCLRTSSYLSTAVRVEF